ncbi:uncharacterized protein PHACADRAFT_105881 [Phanerochaete carnosa HHB-10118-sp]|uniref:ENTH domain-containing protein n=1 Tax=Phanerochaete carnosa (strain HHB-10118-sp) TaxID=650164 RepID=K5VUA6_PHACS|nr:uncharacterized protein PHACADRAFT_105881 [Phanerochaete carnosa HHB-10118-sp]EKM50164.1 hypothetical protein PHACADRAFT_105881 [Phanerochaete carnosa HHB-10118-sp]
MSTSYDKVVKLACKPKAAPPKPKYLDPIIAATWSEDGAVHDVCRALMPRFREPNAIVVFKALIVLHTMIRNGATDNVLSYLSSSDILRLKNISAGAHWEGYHAPQNLQSYAIYLDTRIKAYRDLKHDAIRVQSETNRDMRNSAAIEEDRWQDQEERAGRRFGRRKGRLSDDLGSQPSSSLPQRSQTIAGRKLRVMTVEKGLLRETKTVQKMIDALVECRFYLDNLEDELNITALRMLVKDLLILFQACNEGVINVLEHYFEMSKIDARDALSIYRHFCNETEKVVEFLGVAKKLQNLLNVPIPNLRHAPVSLAGALEEYLNDPNFEQNRIEYKSNKEIADRDARNGVRSAPKPAEKGMSASKRETGNAPSTSSPPPSVESRPASNQAMIDFFSSIEGEQQQMFNAQAGSPTPAAYLQQQAAFNPFQQQLAQQQFGAAQPFAAPQQQVQMQPTGFVPTQQTGMNPFGQQQQTQQPFGGLVQSQQTGFIQPQQAGFLLPQTTGANPFRQSTLFPQTTGMPAGSPFGLQQQPQQAQPQLPFQTGSANPFPQTNAFGGQQQSPNPFPGVGQPTGSNPFPGLSQQQQQPSSNPFPNFTSTLSLGNQQPFTSQSNLASSTNPFPSFANNTSNLASPLAQPASSTSSAHALPRSASVPLSGHLSGSNPPPLRTHQTGSRNPFGQPVAPAPPVPKVPTLFELASGFSQPQQPQANGQISPTALQPQQTGFAGQNGTLISNVASSFALGSSSSSPDTNTSPAPSFGLGSTTSPTGSSFSTYAFSSLSSQPTGATSTGTGALQPQKTGFGGIKPFKPSSSFGAQLLDSLPPIPQSAPTTPDLGGQSKHNPAASLGSSSFLNSQPTGLAGKSPGVGLRPQMTGAAGVANPFRATMFSLSPNTTGAPFGGLNAAPAGNAFGGMSSQPTGFTGGPNQNLFGAGGNFGLSAGSAGTQQQQSGQQQSLI